MNNYVKIFLVSLLITILSILRETFYPFMPTKPTPTDYIYIYTLRFIHFYLFIYTAYFLLFFDLNMFDMYIYLIVIFIVTVLWYIIESCMLSYLELSYYNIDLENTKTTFHSTFYSLFEDYTGIIMIISGILYLMNVSVILYKCVLSIQYKLLYYILFLLLFFDSFYKSRIHTKYYSTLISIKMPESI